ncbi:TIGR04255 family protein [Acidithiobacillus ferrianus]|uniref:TIGR04255 family protein n=2 Tax=Acidithiobacillus ferrianus TaxID=2678518 RepID=A0A845U7H2_9PROT|nr:TIGR04255 family protein [Acidithiobacillus ferrianus]NDU43366.1 TIGR04255 family protein [Acidithiobacillus ferrianus]
MTGKSHQPSGLALPEFGTPPLIETVIGVQFDPLPNLDIPRIGLLWQRFRERLPAVQNMPPLEPVIERAGVRKVSGWPALRFGGQAPLPRCWFLNLAGNELLQIQQDRFIWNWRKVAENDSYPRYEKCIRQNFIEHLGEFLNFLLQENVGDFRPNQCEIIYVNHIISGPEQGWETHKDAGKVFQCWNSAYVDSTVPEIESIQMAVSHIINSAKNEFLGRLHVTIEPAFRNEDDKPIFVMTLTARGKPLNPDISGVMEMLDIGRKLVVETFTAMTTKGMHEVWEKQHGS